MSDRVDVGVGDLKRSAREHWRRSQTLRGAGTSLPASANLLAIYAVECGLKARYLLNQKAHTTALFKNAGHAAAFGSNGHDLSAGLKSALVPMSKVGVPPNVRRAKDKISVPLNRLHEAWRYGAALVPGDEAAISQWFAGIHQWLQESL